MKLSEIVYTFRTEHGYSMETFATVCGLSKGYISMVERDWNPQTKKPIIPTMDTLAKLARGMGMTLNNLISIMDDSPVIVSDRNDVSDEEMELLILYRRLNAAGKRKVFEYLDDLSDNKKYTKDTALKEA